MRALPSSSKKVLWNAAFGFVCLAAASFLLAAGPLNGLDSALGTGFIVFLASGFIVHVGLLLLTVDIQLMSKRLPEDERIGLNLPLRWFGVIGLLVFSLPLLMMLLLLLGLASPG